MLALRLGRVELEGAMQHRDRRLNLVAPDVAGDLDRRGGHDLRLDAGVREGLERLRRHPGMALHPRADDTHLAQVVAGAPLDAEAVEYRRGRAAILRRRREDD